MAIHLLRESAQQCWRLYIAVLIIGRGAATMVLETCREHFLEDALATGLSHMCKT